MKNTEIEFKPINKEFDLKIIGNIGEYTIQNMLDSLRKKEMTIFLHTSGGDGESAWAIRNLILTNKINATIYVSRCESVGMIILSACKTKIAYSHCSFMLHNGQHDNIELNIKGEEKLNRFNKMYQELHPKIKVENKNKYFTAKEMLKMKYINKII